MGHAAAALLIIAQPLGALATVLLPPMAMSRHGASRAGWVLWALAVVLLAVWAATTYRAAVMAGGAGTEGDLLGTVHWLALAVGAALASVLAIGTARSTD